MAAGRRRCRGKFGRADRHQANIAAIAGGAPVIFTVQHDAATDRRTDEDMDEAVQLAAPAPEHLGDSRRRTVILAEDVQACCRRDAGREVHFIPDAVGLGCDIQLAPPASHVVGSGDTDAGHTGAGALGQRVPQGGDIVKGEADGLIRHREVQFVMAAVQDMAAKSTRSVSIERRPNFTPMAWAPSGSSDSRVAGWPRPPERLPSLRISFRSSNSFTITPAVLLVRLT